MGLIYISSINDTGYMDLFKELQKRPEIVFLDTETTGLSAFSEKVLLLQLGIGDNIYVVDVAKTGSGAIVGILNLLKSNGTLCVGHNIKFDIKMLMTNFNVLLTKLFDTMIAEVLLTAGVGDKYPSLADLVLKYCGQVMLKDTRDEFINKEFGSDFTSQQIMYSADDILYLNKIYTKQLADILSNHLFDVCKLENELVPAVVMMELNGIKVDEKTLLGLESSAISEAGKLKLEFLENSLNKLDWSKYSSGLDVANSLRIPVKSKRDKEALRNIVDPTLIMGWALKEFNMDSTTQLPALLSLCGIPVVNTNEKVLTKLPKNDLIDTLLQYRGINKLATTYGSNLLGSVEKSTGRLHTEYSQLGAGTGRFSSRGPNLQNIPATDEYRAMFVAEEGCSFINTDYSQQEFRLAGAVSGEDKIIDAYKAGADMHTATAAIIYKKPLEEVSKKERGFGKTLNFAILYGTSKYGLKKNLNISLDEAEEIISQFYKGYPKLGEFKVAAEDMIAELGYSVTPLGRRRYFPPKPVFATPRDIENHFSKVRREGFNHIIQGGGADVTKIALRNLFYNNPFGERFKIVLQVHDEIGVEVQDSIINEALEFIQTTMKDAFTPFLRGIPAEVESKIGKVWKK